MRFRMDRGSKHRRPRGGLRTRILNALPILGIIVGLVILGWYPATEMIDAYRREQVLEQLDTAVSHMDDSAKQEMLSQAHAYNERLAGLTPQIPSDQIWLYERQLALDGHDVEFAYIIIPKISLEMPIYHGADDAVLSAGVGHLEWSSLPVGGASTHAVLSAHSGMEGMRAFDDIRELEPGDVFAVKVLGELYAYKVTSTEVVLPDELDSTKIVAGKDLMTLVTCTPYGINDHRLLVHAERTKVPADFFDEKPSVADVLTNRRVLPFVLGLAGVAALGALLALRRRRARARSSGVGGKSAHGAVCRKRK